jgi:tRNA A37 threonylcarbamoyladenosine synthetase subunit TsaC/SUA5/YrdC
VARLFDRRAVEKIFALKNRDPAKRLPVFCADFEQVNQIVAVPADQSVQKFLHQFWPGPLTGIFRATVRPLPYLGDNSDGSIAVRVPNVPEIIELCRINGPLAQTSANLSGQSSSGTPSTIIDFRNYPDWSILRPGSISERAVESALR